MDSYLQQHQSNQSQQMNSGLTRYRSAPSSYFTSILSSDGFGGDDLDQLIHSKASNRDFLTRFTWNNTDNLNFSIVEQSSSNLVATLKTETTEVQQMKDFSSVPQMANQNQSQGHEFSTNIKAQHIISDMDSSSSKVAASMKTSVVRSGSSNLIRHSSSPAGLFDQLDFGNEFSTMRGNFGTGNSWDDSNLISEEFLKELRDDDPKLFSNINEPNNQSNEDKNRPPKRLAHHLSLPASSSEFSSALDNLSEDSVLCKLRAKRGCATHPRSIAERVRRSKISERMRKLQELVPNMDKQTNTSDMLDFAVEYIKDLEKQLKGLQENQAKCTCNCN